ncbi:hypothetical protein LINPERHAP2_LOCUS38427 [Linum perenne]
MNSTLKRKYGGTSADGQPPLKRSDGLGTGSNFSDLYLNRSSPSGSDLMPGIRSPPSVSLCQDKTHLKQTVDQHAGSAPELSAPHVDVATSPPPSPSTVASQKAPMIPQELPEMGLEKKMLNPEFLGGDALRRTGPVSRQEPLGMPWLSELGLAGSN